MTREDKLALAGEYVLGLLEGEAAAGAEAMISADPEFHSMVARLSQQLSALDANALPTALPPDLWPRIEAQLAQAAQDDATIDEARSVAIHPASNDNSICWRNLRWPSLAAGLFAAVLAGWFAGRSDSDEPVAVAVLLDEGSEAPGALVEAFDDDSVRLVTLRDFDVPEGRILQVWTLPDQQTGPVSLGTLTGPGTLRLQGPDLAMPQDGQLYEITLEPSPGSPTGRPTGPILVKGLATLAEN